MNIQLFSTPYKILKESIIQLSLGGAANKLASPAKVRFHLEKLCWLSSKTDLVPTRYAYILQYIVLSIKGSLRSS